MSLWQRLGCAVLVAVFEAAGANFPPPTEPAPAPLAEPLTFDALVAYLERHPSLRSIDALLPHLPASYRSRYTLLHRSDSRQGASPEAPRVILYGSDGTLLMAFNGAPGQLGYQALELIQWREAKRAFEMREVTFAAGRAPQISPANPPRCLGCHRSDPRPNWEPYREWPNAYAGFDDQWDRDGEALKAALVNFIRRAERHPRYRFLENLSGGYLRPADGSRRPRDERTPVLHNIGLSSVSARLNFKRMARLIDGTPDFARYRYAVLSVLAACEDAPESYLPQGVDLGISTLDRSYERRSELFLRLFAARGVQVNDWGTSFEAAPLELSTPNSWSSELLYEILRRHRDLAPLFWEFDGYAGPAAQARQDGTTCSNLRQAQRVAEMRRLRPGGSGEEPTGEAE